MKNNSGMGRFGFLVATSFLVIMVFGAYKAGPVYLDKISFEDELMHIATRAGAEDWSERTIREYIVKAGRAEQFRLNREDVKIVTTPRGQAAPKIFVSVKYSRTVEFPGYAHVFRFTSEVSGLIGRL
jgi:hypothetical protein